MHVKGIMAEDVVTIDRNDDLRLLDDIMAERHIRHIPVLEGGQLVGLVTQRDLFKARMSSTHYRTLFLIGSHNRLKNKEFKD